MSRCGHNEYKQLSNATKTIKKSLEDENENKTRNNCTVFRLLFATKKKSLRAATLATTDDAS